MKAIRFLFYIFIASTIISCGNKSPVYYDSNSGLYLSTKTDKPYSGTTTEENELGGFNMNYLIAGKRLMSREQSVDMKITNHYYNHSGNEISFDEFKLEYNPVPFW